MKFSQAFIKNAYHSEIYEILYKLHEVWYKVNALDSKYSDIAARKKEEYRAEFYNLAEYAINTIEGIYQDWIEGHSMDGWWDNWAREDLLNNNGKIHRENQELGIRGTVDISDFVKPLVQQQINKEIRDDNIDNVDEVVELDLDDVYGDDWWDQNIGTIDVILDQAKPEAFRQWVNIFPAYADAIKNVKGALSRLTSVAGSKDMNAIMSAISLALNAAHNSGLMYDHLDMSEEEMNQLSNINTSEWDRQLAVFSKKYNHFHYSN